MTIQVYYRVKIKINNRSISIMKCYCKENSKIVKIIGKEDTMINNIISSLSNKNRSLAAGEQNQQENNSNNNEENNYHRNQTTITEFNTNYI